MPSLCVDARLYKSTGIGTYIQYLLQTLNKIPEVQLIVLHKPEDRELLQGLNGELIPMSAPVCSIKEQFAYFFKIPSCDLFWSPHLNVPLFPIRAKRRAVTLHDVNYLLDILKLSWIKKLYAHLFFRASLTLSNVVMTDSEFSQSEISQHLGFPKEKINCFMPPFRFTPEGEDENPRDRLLFVGTDKAHKNLARALQAYQQVSPKEPLYVVGKVKPIPVKNVVYTGYLPDEELKKLYQKSILLLFPSTYEGYGYPPLEAMASGCAVVTSNCCSLPEVCGDAAEYCDPYDVSSIGSAIQNVLSNPQRKAVLLENGKARVHHLSQVNIEPHIKGLFAK